MERDAMWSPVDSPGLEHLRLTLNKDWISADGEIITTMFAERPERFTYSIRCDPQWRVRELRIAAQLAAAPAIILRADGAGHWSTARGDALPDLDGCIDVDFMATPFTNTLPIQRCKLNPGASVDIMVAYVNAPALELVRVPQRYTCLASQPDGRRFRYASLDSGYTTELEVDADGLVIDYPGIWRRVWPV